MWRCNVSFVPSSTHISNIKEPFQFSIRFFAALFLFCSAFHSLSFTFLVFLFGRFASGDYKFGCFTVFCSSLPSTAVKRRKKKVHQQQNHKQIKHIERSKTQKVLRRKKMNEISTAKMPVTIWQKWCNQMRTNCRWWCREKRENANETTSWKIIWHG